MKNKKLTGALVAEHSRTSHARSGSSHALERVAMAEGLKKGLEGEGRAGGDEAGKNRSSAG